jgi:hypothetical protein
MKLSPQHFFSCSLLFLISCCPDGHAFVFPKSQIARVSSTTVGPLKESEGFPNVIRYPKTGWGLSKPKPKQSLVDLGQDKTAAPWILNIIEFFHWFSFPIGFGLFWTMFSNIEKLGAAINPSNPMFSVFFLLFAHVTQVYGGGISGNMMHQYEGWQVAEFRNPLKTEDAESEFNNAWLRAVAYQMLFSFQTLGVLLTWVGVNGVDTLLQKGLILLTAFVITLAPELPHCTSAFPKLMKKIGLEKFWSALTNGNRPVFPISIYLFIAFLANSIPATLAYIKMFGAISWAGVPIMESLPAVVTSTIPFFLIAFGGIFEGIRAETTFNQWDHLIAFLFLDLGLFLHAPYYLRLIGA